MMLTRRTVRSAAVAVALGAIVAVAEARANHFILPCLDHCGDLGPSPPSPSMSATSRWTAIGPEGANVVALAIDPEEPLVAFAGTLGAGVLKTIDGGMTWTTANAGLQSSNIAAMAIAPTMPPTLYAATGAGVFRSIDGGESWTGANGNLGDPSHAKVLAVDPTSPTTVYAGTDAGLFKTVDGGNNWTALSLGLERLTPRVITIDSSSPSTVYVGVDDYNNDSNYGLLKSTDGGASWSRIYTCPPFGDGGAPSVTALAIDPLSSSHLYLIAGRITDYPDGSYSIGDALLASNDGGTTWVPAALPISQIVSSFDEPVSLAIDPSTPHTVYVGTAYGLVFQSSDAGDHWAPVTQQPQAAGANVLATAARTPVTPAALYVGGGNGIHQTLDQAQTWKNLSLGVRRVAAWSTVVDPGNASIIYTNAGGSPSRTADGGTHWSDAALGMGGERIEKLAIDTVTTSTLYAVGSSSLFKTANGGSQWTPITDVVLDGVTTLAVAPSQPATLYAGRNHPKGVVKSTDGGMSWQLANISFYMAAIAVDPADANVVYGASVPTSNPNIAGKLFKSTDGAAHWTVGPFSLPFGEAVTSFAVDPHTSSTIYASYANYGIPESGGVYRSTDGGATWAAAQEGLPTAWVWKVIIDPSSPIRLYAATNVGIFSSTTGGENWALLDSGLGDSAVMDVSIDQSGSILRASTAFGLFEYRISGNAAPAGIDNYQGLWWAKGGSEPYWGINFAHQGDLVFGTWYTYDTTGKAWWLSTLAVRTAAGANTYTGPINVESGPPFNKFMGAVKPTAIGSATVMFADANNGTFAYTVNLGAAAGSPQLKSISRFDLGTGPQPTCTYSAAPNLATATNYQGLWWVTGGTEPGWGINFAHQGNSVFATWYTYDIDGAPLWLSVLAGRVGSTNVYTGSLYRTAGPRFDAYDETKAVLTQVGTATLTFADGNNSTFSYTTSGAGGLPVVTQAKSITRFLFAAPAGTVCN